MSKKITVHICTRDRWTELALLLQSLRTQTYQDWDLLICDDASGTPILQSQFLVALLNRIKLENHKVKIIRNENSFGCCYARNRCIDEDDFENPLTFRCDDDVILESEYLEKLMHGIINGHGKDWYDIVSGVILLLTHPELKRDIKFVEPIINRHEFDKDGNIIKQSDDCGYCYLHSVVIPTHQFRTNCLYKSEIHKKVRYPENLTSVAFREEGFFSFGAILEGYKIGINTGAVAWHLQTPSGGNRRPDYAECVKIDNETFLKWCKKQFQKHGDFLEKYNKEVIKNARTR